MLREVRLYGHLGKRFGRVHRFDVASPAEAVAALRANFSGFQSHVLAHNLPGYRVLVDGAAVTRDQLRLRAHRGTIKIVPVVAGSKRGGLLQVIAGAALIVAGTFTGNPFLVKAGIATALGGVVSLLSPAPKGPKERPENEPSHLFDGAVNTTAQGQAVPVLLGRLVVGSAVVSSGINAEELAGAQAPVVTGPQAMPAEQPVIKWETGLP